MAQILMMAMALRKDSFNKKLIKIAHQIMKNKNLHEIELLSFNDFPMPVYDGDIETSGIPDSVRQLATQISQSDAIIFSTPEYNGGIPGPFKNAIDWVSRIKPSPWSGKHVLLIGASISELGAVRGLWHSRVPLEKLECFVYPEMFGLPKADDAFDKVDQLKDSKMEERLTKLLQKFSLHVQTWTQEKKTTKAVGHELSPSPVPK